MVKKIRFPLEMEQGVEVRSLEELRENFSLVKVLVYLSNGKLVTWLKDRYAYDIADAIEGLNTEDDELAKKVCQIFEVEYDEEVAIDLEKAEERNKKLGILKEYTTEQRFLDVVDVVAFTQDDLYDLLDEEETNIYLCGEKFSIPLSKKGMTYVGVNNPVVVVDSKKIVDWNEKGISLIDVRFDSAYQQIVDKQNQPQITKEKLVEEVIVEKVLFRMTVEDVFTITGRGTVSTGHIDEGMISVGDTITLNKKGSTSREVVIAGVERRRKLIDTDQKGEYVGLLLRGIKRDEVSKGDVLEKVVHQKQKVERFVTTSSDSDNYKNSYLNFMLSTSDKEGAKYCYEKLSNQINDLNYDIDTDVKDVKQKLLKDGLAGLADNYISNL
jgi:hypothetical protein